MKFNLLTTTWFFLILMAQTLPSWAALNVTVNPSDGSNTLRFGLVSSRYSEGKEVRIRVSSTDGKQYQVFQRLVAPITNERGESLDPQALATVTRAGSSSSGSLYLQNQDRLTYSDQLIYTSSITGESDAFSVEYAVLSDRVNGQGRFNGQVVYTVRASGGGQDQIFLDLFFEAESSWKSSVEGRRSPGRIVIKDTDTIDQPADFVQVTFSGNVASEVRVYQQLENDFINESGLTLLPEAILMEAGGEARGGVRVDSPTEMKRGRTLIYSGQNSDDSFIISYALKTSKEKLPAAGHYTGKIKYFIETGQATQEFLVDVQCEVQPQFVMNLEFPPGGVRFDRVLPTNPVSEKVVEVHIRSNLAQPYSVMQDLASLMTNAKGEVFDKKFFQMKVEVDPSSKGRSRFADFSPVETGEYPVFSSDGQGSSATFKVVYRLQAYPGMQAGDFSAPIRFTLNQN